MYCLAIALEMVQQFHISEDEAIGRISEFWEGNDITDEDDMIYHESPKDWAAIIYSDDEFWWKVEDKTQLKPRKYPRGNLEQI